MELRSRPSARNFDPSAAVFLGHFVLASLALPAKSFPSTGRQDGLVQCSVEVPSTDTSGSTFHTQHHLDDVLKSEPSSCPEHQLCAALRLFLHWYFSDCELIFNGSDESICLPLSLRQLLS